MYFLLVGTYLDGLICRSYTLLVVSMYLGLPVCNSGVHSKKDTYRSVKNDSQLEHHGGNLLLRDQHAGLLPSSIK